MDNSAGPRLSNGRRATLAAAGLLAGGLAWAAAAPEPAADRTAAITGVSIVVPWSSRFTLEAEFGFRGGWRGFSAQLRLVHWLPPDSGGQAYYAVGVGVRSLRFPITWHTGTVAAPESQAPHADGIATGARGTCPARRPAITDTMSKAARSAWRSLTRRGARAQPRCAPTPG